MDDQPVFGFKEVFTAIIGDMVKAVTERHGASKEQHLTRAQAGVNMIMSFTPRDVIEAMLVGHLVMFHTLMVESVYDTLRGEMHAPRRPTHGNPVALKRAFFSNLDRFERYRLRPSEGRRDEPQVRAEDAAASVESIARAPVAPASTPMRAAAKQAAPPAWTPRAGTQDGPASTLAAATGEVPARAEPTPAATPFPETPAFRRAASTSLVDLYSNKAAMAALDAGDAEGFAQAMGIEQPSEEFLAAAAAPGSPFDRQAGDPWPTGEASSGDKV